MALTERQEDDNINSYIQEGAFGVKGKSMRTLEEVKRLADGFRKLYDDARVFGVKDGRKVRADDTAGGVLCLLTKRISMQKMRCGVCTG